MKVKLDLSELKRAEKRAERELESVPKILLTAVTRGAQFEQRSHRYQNRTGDLELSTQGILNESTTRLSEATIEMGMPYASYVVARGFSSFPDIVAVVQQQITSELNQLAIRVCRL